MTRDILKAFNAPRTKTNRSSAQGGAGYDNARENIDPHIKTQVLNTQEAIIERLTAVETTIGTLILGFTAGSIAYSDGSKITEDNTNLFWDDTNKRLGIGTNSPASRLTLNEDGEIGTANGLRFGGGGFTGIFESANGTLGLMSDGSESGKILFGNAAFEMTGRNHGMFIWNIEGGTVTKPIYSFVNDTNTGMSWADNDTLVLITGGIERVRVNSSGNIGIGTASPDTSLQIVGDTKLGDDNTNYVEIGTTGDVVFVGGSGLAFGEIYSKDNTTATTITTQNVPVQVTTFDTNGESNNTTPDHTNDHITITKAGKYMITVSSSIESVAGPGSKVSLDVYKNNGATIFNNLHAHRDISGGGGDTGAVAISGIIDLAVNDTVEVWITNTSNTANYTIEDITLSIIQIGG